MVILHTCTHEWSGPFLPRVLPRVLLEMNIKPVVSVLRDVFELMLESLSTLMQCELSHNLYLLHGRSTCISILLKLRLFGSVV